MFQGAYRFSLPRGTCNGQRCHVFQVLASRIKKVSRAGGMARDVGVGPHRRSNVVHVWRPCPVLVEHEVVLNEPRVHIGVPPRDDHVGARVSGLRSSIRMKKHPVGTSDRKNCDQDHNKPRPFIPHLIFRQRTSPRSSSHHQFEAVFVECTHLCVLATIHRHFYVDAVLRARSQSVV